MARPRKPQVGTPERQRRDLADFGKVYCFIDARIQRAGGGRGSKRQAVEAAAREFEIHEKTAERHYARVRRSMNVDPMLAALENVKQMRADTEALFTHARLKGDEWVALLHRAFTEDERRKLRKLEGQFGLQLARERIELIELRKQLKRKRK
jgi:hypothetical protein